MVENSIGQSNEVVVSVDAGMSAKVDGSVCRPRMIEIRDRLVEAVGFCLADREDARSEFASLVLEMRNEAGPRESERALQEFSPSENVAQVILATTLIRTESKDEMVAQLSEWASHRWVFPTLLNLVLIWARNVADQPPSSSEADE